MAGEEQRKDFTIKDSKFDAGRDIHIGDKTEITNISRMVVYLTTESGYSKDETQRLVEEFENQLQKHQADDKDREVRQERYAASLGRAMSIALRDVHDDQRHALLKLVGEWIVPIIEKCKESDDYHSPYGSLCAYLINGMCPPSFRLFSSQAPELTMKTVMDWIFTTKDLLEDVQGYEKVNTAYLEMLTKYFPAKSSAGKPFGFYLTTRYPVTSDGIMETSSFSFDEKPLRLIYVTDDKLNGWMNIAKGEDSKYEHDGLNGVAQRINKVFASDKVHIFAVQFDENRMFLWDTGKQYIEHRRYSIQIDFKGFSSFLMGIVSDFLRLGSKAIDDRRAHEKDINRLLGMVPKT